MAGYSKEQYKKLQASVLYLLDDNILNRTKLNKLLYFSDTLSIFRKEDKSTVTGVDYYKFPYGPVPDEISHTRDILVGAKYLDCRKDDSGLYYEYFYTLNTDKFPNKESLNELITKHLAKDEILILEKVKEKLDIYNATELSMKSHEFRPWLEAEHKINMNLCLDDDGIKEWFKTTKLLN